ncbi:MAG: antitoxin HicB [Cellulomonas sp.]|nr:antitoxin HicB [Cellulomonas sp.]MCR6649691.1 antitoxin HicB [Cellulomonas sp.]
MVAVKDRYLVRAVRWEHGWELHIAGAGVTQSRSLSSADRQVRDYLETLYDVDASSVALNIVPELDGLNDVVQHARERSERAAREQREAAAETRRAAKGLRDAGLSVDDTAVVMGVSKGRVSQFLKGSRS